MIGRHLETLVNLWKCKATRTFQLQKIENKIWVAFASDFPWRILKDIHSKIELQRNDLSRCRNSIRGILSDAQEKLCHRHSATEMGKIIFFSLKVNQALEKWEIRGGRECNPTGTLSRRASTKNYDASALLTFDSIRQSSIDRCSLCFESNKEKVGDSEFGPDSCDSRYFNFPLMRIELISNANSAQRS